MANNPSVTNWPPGGATPGRALEQARPTSQAPSPAESRSPLLELRALFGALMCAGTAAPGAGWRLFDDRVRINQRIGLELVRVGLAAATPADAWREVCAISPLALDVLAVLIGAFEDHDSDVRLLRCADVLEAKRCRRQGEERLALEEQVGREIMRLDRFTFGHGEEPLFSVAPVGQHPTSFVVSREGPLALQPAAAPRLRIDRRIVEFDHRANRGADVLAKKLGLYFSLGGCGPGTAPLVRNVRAVLRSVGLAEELRAGGRCGRLADRFEEALLRLQDVGLFAVTYRGGAGELIGGARVKGWLARWLDAEVVVAALS
jgi:hypothetical protein